MLALVKSRQVKINQLVVNGEVLTSQDYSNIRQRKSR